MIRKSFLKVKYSKQRLSVRQIANELNCSQNTVTYWLNKYGIQKRTISEAVYALSNPEGDPFSFKTPSSSKEWFLYGLGLGLFWGEGNKVNKHSVRLGNSDPALIKSFIDFLEKIYRIDKNRLRFGLQVFSDMPAQGTLSFWSNFLQIPEDRFYKTIVTPSVKRGTYRKKSAHGVLILYFSNSKLRDIILTAIEELRIGKLPS